MPAKIDVVGLKFGRLLVLGPAEHANGRRRVQCQCDCGTVTVVEPRMLRKGRSKSCGCLQRDIMSAVSSGRTKHGLTNTPEYDAWTRMKRRCYSPKDSKYRLYGGRGITVCERWLSSFEAFYEDMGDKPTPSHSLDRIDVDGNYEPSNCRWATPTVQGRNKQTHRLVWLNGKQMPLSQACETAGVNYRAALYRLNRGTHWMPHPLPPAREASSGE